MVVYHYWSVFWARRDVNPPVGFPRVVCIARRAVCDPFRGPGPFPADVDRAARFWDRAAGGGYDVAWHVSVVDDGDAGDGADDAGDADAAIYRVRRRLLAWVMRVQCPMFAEHFADEHVGQYAEYFGLERGA